VPTAKKFSDALARVIIAATKKLEPVKLFARQSSAGFAHNRRREGVKGGNPSKEDTLDHDVPILDVVDARGNRKAIVYGYACHNTTIDPQDRRLCADWAGFAREHLRKKYPTATMLFITGCGADQNPEPRGTVEHSMKYGQELGEAIESALSHQAAEITGGLHSALENVPLPLQKVTREDLDAAIASDDPPRRVKAKFLLDQLARGEKLLTEYPAPMQAVRLGNELLMIVMSGETVVDWSHRFKREFANRAKRIWVAGYCNDMYGYVPTLRIQKEGGYEGGRANLWSWVPSPFTEEVERVVAGAVHRLVEKVTTETQRTQR
jgi:hypothetical protein